MATKKQIRANRRNAQRSTGPRTAAGKAVSRMNALKTGIDAAAQVIRGEHPGDLEALTAEYFLRFHPATPEQRALVDTLVACDWLQRRLRRAESQTWESEFERAERWEIETAAPLGRVFSSHAQTFSRLQRRIDSTERNYHRALKELQRLQPPAPPEPSPQPLGAQTTSSDSSENGFVPQPSSLAVASAPHPAVAPTPLPHISPRIASGARSTIPASVPSKWRSALPVRTGEPAHAAVPA